MIKPFKKANREGVWNDQYIVRGGMVIEDVILRPRIATISMWLK